MNIKKVILFCLSIFLLFSLTGCQLFKKPASLLNEKKEKEQILLNQEPNEQKLFRWLDGLLVEEGKEKFLPVAVVLDNLSGVPLPNLVNVSLLYELPVEGGFTRFLAFFDLESVPENLGPVRSARPYLAEIAEEYQAIFIHAGGSSDVLFKLKQGFYKLFDLDEIGWQGKYFFRTKEPRPHNLYIKKEEISKFLTDRKIENLGKFTPWQFSQEIKEGQAIEKIKIVFSSLYEVEWQYDTKISEYKYFQNKKIYKDKNDQEIRVKNLIIQYTEINIIDAEGRRKIKLDGQGKALIFQNGQVIEGKWIKEASRTRFYTSDGQEMTFLPGPTWVGIVPPTNKVIY